MNSAALPGDLHKLFVEALNSGDLDALVALYAFGAFLMARSGPARGISAIRKALADYAAMKPTIQLTTRAESYKRGTRRCLWQTGDFTEPPPMAEMCQPLVRVSKSLVASRKAVGATSSISLRVRLIHMPRIYDVSGHPVLVLNRLQVNPATKRKRIVGGRNANGADSSNLGCFLILLGVVR